MTDKKKKKRRERKISKAEERKRKEKSIERSKLYRLQMYYRSYLLSRMRTVFTLHSKTKRTSNYTSYFSFTSHLLIASDFSSSFHSPDNYTIVNNSVFLYNLYIFFHLGQSTSFPVFAVERWPVKLFYNLCSIKSLETNNKTLPTTVKSFYAFFIR